MIISFKKTPSLSIDNQLVYYSILTKINIL